MLDPNLEKLLLEDLDRLAEASARDETVAPPRVQLKKGERRLVTVLFLDMEGFTSLSERLDHEIVDVLISRLFTVFQNHLESRGGTVEKFEGDAIMAAFGAEVSHEDDAARAIDAGLAILDTFQSLKPCLQRVGLRTGIRLGMHSGEVTRSQRGTYEVITGDTVNVAARLEENAPRNSLLVSRVVRDQAGDRFTYEDHPPVRGEGKSAPVETCIVVGRALAKARWERSSLSARSRFTGREEELELLRRVYRQCQEAAGKPPAGSPGPVRHILVGLEGDPGIGKSRLIHEFLRTDVASGIPERPWRAPPPPTVLRGEAASYDSRPYEILVSMLARRLGMNSVSGSLRTPFAAWVSDLSQYLTDADQLRDQLPLLGFMMGLPYEDDPRLEHLEPQKLHQEIAVACRLMFEALAMMAYQGHQAPLTLVCEDYHWVKEPSRAVLDFVLTQVKSPLPLFILVSYRPGTHLPRLPEESVQTIRLPLHPLSPGDEESLLRNLLGGDRVDPEFRELIRQRSGGNPYYVEELVIRLLHEHRLEQRERAWRCKGAIQPTDLPASLRRLILSRVDILPHRLRTVLQLASVLGHDFTPAMVRWMQAHLAESGDPKARLDELVDLAFLEMGSLRPESYTFKHVLTREVVYETLLHGNRRVLHRLYAEYLETQGAEPRETGYYELAENWRAGGEPGRATQYYLKAGQVAQRAYDHRTALASYSLALSMLPAGDVEKGRCLRARGRILQLTGQMAAARDDYDASLAMAQQGNDRRGEAVSLLSLGAWFVAQGKHPEAMACLPQALELSRSIGDRDCEGRSLHALGRVFEAQNRLDEALRHYQLALGLSQQIGDRRAEAEVLCQLGLIHQRQTQFPQAFQSYQRALRINRRIRDRLGVATALEGVGFYYQRCGMHGRAREYFRKALDLKREAADRLGEAELLLHLAQADHLQYRYSAALAGYEQALAIARPCGYRQVESTALVSLGEVKRLLGDYDAALQACRQVLEIEKLAGVGVARMTVRICLGIALGAIGNFAAAFRYLDEAYRDLRDTGNEIGSVYAMLSRGEIHRYLGHYDQALGCYHEAQVLLHAVPGPSVKMLHSRLARRVGEIELNQGRPAEARKHFVAALESARKSHAFDEEAEALMSLATWHYLRADLRESRRAARQALTIYERLGLAYKSLPSRSLLARVLVQQGDRVRALALSEQVVRWLQERPDTLSHLDLQPQHLWFTHYLVRQATGAPDHRDALLEARRLLQSWLDRIGDDGCPTHILNEPLNRLLGADRPAPEPTV